MTLQVPANAQPGQMVQFQDPSTQQTFQVAVPHGYMPGSTFQVQLASSTERSESDLESAMRAAQTSAAVAGILITGAAKASIAMAKATYAGAKFAHQRGWDKQAANMATKAASMSGSLAKAAMNSSFAKLAVTVAAGGSTWDAATDFAAGETFQNMLPEKQSIMYVVVPPDTKPGQQMYVLAPSGQTMMVVVPDGAAPGTQFACHLPP